MKIKSLFEEINSLIGFLDENVTPLDVLDYIYKYKLCVQDVLQDAVPNVCTALRMFLSLPVSVAARGRSFSK